MLVYALFFAAQACGSATEPAGPKSIDALRLAALIADGEAPFVVDVRTEGEFTSGHIPGAVNVPHDELADRLAELPSDRSVEVVVHCQSGGRAQVARSILTEAGFTNVIDLEGHMAGWRDGNHPIE
jgi:rhodanese-related sulfurtransferase